MDKKNKTIFGILAGLLLLVLGGICIVSAIHTRNEIAKEKDAELSDRMDIFFEADYYGTPVGETIGDIDAISIGEMEAHYALEENAAKRLSVLEAGAPAMSVFHYTYEGTNEDGKFVTEDYDYPIFSDKYGNQLYIWHNRLAYAYNGLIYGNWPTSVLSEDTIEVSEDGVAVINVKYAYDFVGITTKAINNKELQEDAKAIVEKQTTGYGWNGSYRYMVEEEEITETLRKYGAEGDALHYVLFVDASTELAAWKYWTIANTFVALFVYLVVLVISYLFLRTPGKKKVEEVVAAEPEKEEEQEKKTISENLAKNLLDRLESTEQSIGPNGYLDEMRELIREADKK